MASWKVIGSFIRASVHERVNGVKSWETDTRVEA
jgi:hypothetical protein